MKTESPESTMRIPELDGLRGVAVVLVVAHHCTLGLTPANRVDRLLLSASGLGWIGVDLFFVLSGYLITGILLNATGSRASLLTFYARRALRILPPYYLLLFALFVAGPALGWRLAPRGAAEWPWFALLGSNLLMAAGRWPEAVLVPLWSVSIEEHFYLLWPFFLRALPEGRLLSVVVGLALGGAALRATLLTLGCDVGSVYVFTLTHLDGLALGSALAIFLRRPGSTITQARAMARPLAAVAMLAAAFVIISGQSQWGAWGCARLSIGLLGVSLGMTALLALIVTQAGSGLLRRTLASTPLRTAGRLSYGMYLFHQPIIEIARRSNVDARSLAPQGSAVWPYALAFTIVVLLMVMAFAEVSWRLVETPFLRLKRHFPYPRPSA